MLLIPVDVSSVLEILKDWQFFFIPVVLVNLVYLVKTFSDFTRNWGKENGGKTDVVYK